jgi:hypothetical protein
MKLQQYIFSFIVLCFFTNSLLANERHFSYTYETAVLPLGLREVEVWNTYRSGRENYYRRFDQRIEYEMGVANNLQLAFYLNYSQKLFQEQHWFAKDSASNESRESLQNDFTLSFSNEWKYKFADPVADPIGCALYGEWTLGLNEFELEGKFLFDKKIESLLFALNIVGEQEWETEWGSDELETTSETKLEFDAGVSTMLSPNVSCGIESRQLNVISNGEVEHSAIFLGPVFSYATEQWWATFTVLPQIVSLKKGTNKLDLKEYERMQARLLFSFHL